MAASPGSEPKIDESAADVGKIGEKAVDFSLPTQKSVAIAARAEPFGQGVVAQGVGMDLQTDGLGAGNQAGQIPLHRHRGERRADAVDHLRELAETFRGIRPGRLPSGQED